MTTRPLSSSSVDRRRRLSKSGETASRDGSSKGGDGPKRIGIACASCRRREENMAVKERKQALKQRKDQLRVGSTDDGDDEPTLPEETQLSVRRRWSRTLGLDVRSQVPPSSGHSAAASRLSVDSPSGLSTAAHAWHISTPNGPRTAPVTSSRTSYFDFAVTADSSYTLSTNGGSSMAAPSPAATQETATAPLAVLPPTPSQPWSAAPTPSPRTRLASLPETTDYPLTPPTEPIRLDHLVVEERKEPAPWLLPAPIPMPPRRYTSLSHSHSVPDFPQSAPGPHWQLWHAIPAPGDGINPSFISPALTDRESLAPSCFPPSPANPPSLGFAIPPADSSTHPAVLTPVSTYESAPSLGLQLFPPSSLDSAALALNACDEGPASVWATSSSAVTAQEASGTPDRYQVGGWTQSWLEEQSNRRQEYRDDGLPVW
ncbi:hypothetical protein JCM8097_003408 [Rhodosporidiobolus ruineniae]